MFHDFFELKSELEAKGERFDRDTLRQLAYRDLILAATGDAGQTACTPELVAQVQLERLQQSLTMGPERILAEGIAQDAAAYRARMAHVDDLPRWEHLSPLAQTYFLVRCLRAHVDDPVPRLSQLRETIKLVDPQPTRLHVLLGIIEAGATQAQVAAEEAAPYDFRHMRRVFQGFQLILDFLTPAERAICLEARLSNYHCTAGCFTPTEA